MQQNRDAMVLGRMSRLGQRDDLRKCGSPRIGESRLVYFQGGTVN